MRIRVALFSLYLAQACWGYYNAFDHDAECNAKSEADRITCYKKHASKLVTTGLVFDFPRIDDSAYIDMLVHAYSEAGMKGPEVSRAIQWCAVFCADFFWRLSMQSNSMLVAGGNAEMGVPDASGCFSRNLALTGSVSGTAGDMEVCE